MKYAKIKPTDTTVDHRYQREMDAGRVDAMARAYDRNLVGVPVVSSREDGTFVRIDGQHRVAAAIAAGLGSEPLLMEVHEGLSLRDEAELFLRLNGGRKAVGAIDKYRARLEAQEPVAVEIQATLRRFGLRIVKAPTRNGLMCVQAVERAHHNGNLDRVMHALSAWLDGDPDAFDGEFVRGVSAFFAAFPDADPVHLASRLESIAPARLRARLRRESKQTLSSMAEAARFVFSEIYNHRTPRAKRVIATNVAHAGQA